MTSVEMNVISGYVQAVMYYETCDDNYAIIDRYIEDGDNKYCIKYCFEPGKLTVVITKEESLVYCAEIFAIDNWTYVNHGNIVEWITRNLKPVGES